MPERRLTGHKHFVSDVQLSMDGQWAISASWDGTCRLFDVKTHEQTRQFFRPNRDMPKGDILSVAFSADNRQVRPLSREASSELAAPRFAALATRAPPARDPSRSSRRAATARCACTTPSAR